MLSGITESWAVNLEIRSGWTTGWVYTTAEATSDYSVLKQHSGP